MRFEDSKTGLELPALYGVLKHRTFNSQEENDMTREQERKYKRILKRAFNQKPAKAIKSISDDWRTIYKPNDESYYEVALFEAEGMTDEEIEENVESFRIHYVWRE